MLFYFQNTYNDQANNDFEDWEDPVDYEEGKY
jgi:hypothetical protein